ncbi:MAG: hypothetical protein H6704_30275 [Myxococcales bacterium]|nr:hypothetical protein [Myxococcales bacterium]
MTRRWGWALWALAAAGCGGGSDDGPEAGLDGAAGDAAPMDAAPMDAASVDGAVRADRGPDIDGAASDAQPTDAATGDAARVDGAPVDAGARVDAAIIDAGPPVFDAAPPPCAATPPPDGPVIALEYEGTWETHLPPGFDAATLGLDDRVVPAPRVARVSVQPVAPAGEADTRDEDCPSTVAVERLFDTGTPDVLATRVTAEGGGRARTGLVTLPVGEAVLEGSAPGAAEGAWWVVFEPAIGPQRTWVGPASGAGDFAIAGLPDVPGTVALVRGAGLRLDVDVTHAPPGFSSGWRYLSDAVYAATVLDLGAPVTLRPVDGGRAGLDGLVLGADRRAAIVPVPRDGLAGEVTLPCGATLSVEPVGFVEVDLPGAEGLPPPGPHATTLECEGEMGAVAVTLRSMNGRDAAVVLRLRDEGGAP